MVERRQPFGPVIIHMNANAPHWEHFDHDADIGIRGIAPTLAQAFEFAALALTAIITNPSAVEAARSVSIHCSGQDNDLLFLDWINELIYRMAADNALFGRFEVAIDHGELTATAFGESVDRQKHQPVVEIKGATFTELRVYRNSDAMWIAQCVVDV
jgi:SHS2 domain-containing protein